jgi:hypothetical protein
MLPPGSAFFPQDCGMANVFILVNVNPEKKKGRSSFQDKMTEMKFQ